MDLIIKSKAARLILAAFEVAVFLLMTFWVGKTYLADVVSRRLDVDSLRVATQLDPGNADYHIDLGRIYQYSLTDINTPAALEELNHAAELNPFDAQAWLDLGAAQEIQGQLDQAESSLRRADYLAPELPHFQWAIGNFFLLRGNLDEALRHFKIVLAGGSQYGQAIFSTAWKAVGDGDEILAKLIPDRIDAQFRYLEYLVGQRKLSEAEKVWRKIDASSSPFDPAQAVGYAAAYIDALLGSGEGDKAYQVWSALEEHKLISKQSEPGNLVSNGDFEGEMRNLGFGWRIYNVPGVYAGLDSTVFHSGGHSLAIAFSGSANFYYHAVFHYVKVTPGVRYRVEAYFKTEGITTDSGPRLEVSDAFDARVFNVFSEQLTGTNVEWTLLSADFTPSRKTHYVTVSIARVPSEKLDNKIAGKVWVDDVKVSPLEPRSADARR